MLEKFLVTELFTFLLVFCRIGAGVMLIPAIGEAYVAVRIRLLLAVMISLILTPVYSTTMPPLPGSPLALMMLLMAEILVGLFIGVVCRMLISVMHVAGMIVSFQSSLAAATMFDINQATQGTVFGNFLSVTAAVILFNSDLHHVILRGLGDSYGLFPPGTFPPTEDMTNYLAQLLSDCFLMATKITAPFLVIGLLINLGAGVLSRLMPNMQVFFVIMPAQIMLSFLLLMTMLSAMMLWFMQFYGDTIGAFLAP